MQARMVLDFSRHGNLLGEPEISRNDSCFPYRPFLFEENRITYCTGLSTLLDSNFFLQNHREETDEVLEIICIYQL